MRGSASERPRDRDQLPLAGGEPGAALAHDVVETVLEARGDAVDPDRARRGCGPPRRSRRATRSGCSSTIVPLKRNGSCRTTPSCRRYERQLHLAQLDAVDPHGTPGRGRQKRATERRERRLATAGLAKARGRGSRPAGTSQLESVDAPARRRTRTRRGRGRGGPSMRPSGSRARPVDDVVLGVEHGRDLPHRRGRRLHLAVELGELLQRLEHELTASRSPAISVPIVERAARRSAARRRRARRPVATTPSSSMAGKKTDESFCA